MEGHTDTDRKLVTLVTQTLLHQNLFPSLGCARPQAAVCAMGAARDGAPCASLQRAPCCFTSTFCWEPVGSSNLL